MYKYEELRERVFNKLSELRRKYSGPDLQAQKVSYLEEMIDTFHDQYIEDEDGNNRTSDFMVGLQNIILDPANREVLYHFEKCRIQDLSNKFRYKNEPSLSFTNAEAFKIIYIPAEVEVGRCLLYPKRMSGEIEVLYVEIADDFKSQITIGPVMSDCILGEFGFRVRVEYNKEFQGKPIFVEDVRGKVSEVKDWH